MGTMAELGTWADGGPEGLDAPDGVRDPAALPALAGALTMQRFGRRPAGLPDDARASPEWEELRREIYKKAMRLKGGVTYDFRVLLTETRYAGIAGRLMWQTIRHLKPQVLIGPGFGAAPLLFATALAALEDGVELLTLMVRDKRKGHNQKRWVEGNHKLAAGKRSVFIDDFMRRGSAMALVRQALKAEKLKVDLIGAGLFYDMWDPLVSRQLSASDFPVVAVYTRHDMGLSRDCFDARPPLMRGVFPEFIHRPPRWWRMALNETRSYAKKCAPLIVDDAVFVADDRSTLWKHDLHSGEPLWTVPSLRSPIKGVVQLLQHADGAIVYGCYDGTLTRVDADSGEVRWRRRIDSSIHATPTLDPDRDRLFINTEQWNEGEPTGHVQCLRLSTGAVLWKQRLAWWPPGCTALCRIEDIVVSPCNDKTLSAYDATTGTRRWTTSTEGLVRGRPLIHDGRVYAVTETGHLHCLDLHSGRTVWTSRCGRGHSHHFPIVKNGLIFVLDGHWHMTAIDAETGVLRWISRFRSPGCWCPVEYGDLLVVLSEDGHLAVLSIDDEVKVWETGIPGTYRQPPAIAKDTLVVASNTAGLIAYDINMLYHERWTR